MQNYPKMWLTKSCTKNLYVNTISAANTIGEASMHPQIKEIQLYAISIFFEQQKGYLRPSTHLKLSAYLLNAFTIKKRYIE